MNHRLAYAFFGVVLLANTSSLRADEPDQIPKDGCWARYFMTVQIAGGLECTGKRACSLVGTTTENAEKCRWVEIQSVYEIDGREHKELLKFLIPEKELSENEKPLESLNRAWQKNNDGPVEKLRFNQPLGSTGLSGSADIYFGRYLHNFPGPQQKSKSTPKSKVIEFQQGRLEMSEGRVGQHVAMRKSLTSCQKQEYAS